MARADRATEVTAGKGGRKKFSKKRKHFNLKISQVAFETLQPEEFCTGLISFLDGATEIFCPREAQEEVNL